jgi:hypothetical protein
MNAPPPVDGDHREHLGPEDAPPQLLREANLKHPLKRFISIPALSTVVP